MNANEVYTKAGWIPAVRQLADAIGDGGADLSSLGSLTLITTANATDPETTMALANINKAKINSIITALKALAA